MSPPDRLGPLLRREARRLRVDPREQLQRSILAAIHRPEAAPAHEQLRQPSWRWRLAGIGAGLAAAAGIAAAVTLVASPAAPAAPAAPAERGVAAARPLPGPTPPALELPAAQPLEQELDALASDLAHGGALVLAAMPPAPRHS
jgi:hypothetical protein